MIQKELVKEQTKSLLRKSKLKKTTEEQRYNSDIVDAEADARYQQNSNDEM